jgi:hypothetical protein
VLGHWVEGPALAALGLGVTAGALAGQVLGTRRGVRKVLEALGLRAPADLAAMQTLPSAPDRPTPDGDGSTGDGEWQAPEDAAAEQAGESPRQTDAVTVAARHTPPRGRPPVDDRPITSEGRDGT